MPKTVYFNLQTNITQDVAIKLIGEVEGTLRGGNDGPPSFNRVERGVH